MIQVGTMHDNYDNSILDGWSNIKSIGWRWSWMGISRFLFMGLTAYHLQAWLTINSSQTVNYLSCDVDQPLHPRLFSTIWILRRCLDFEILNVSN